MPSARTHFIEVLKQFVKKTYFMAGGDRLFRKRNKGYLLLVYHSVPTEGSWYYDLPLKDFEKQVSYLVEAFETGRIIDFIENPEQIMYENQLHIGLTFDDGYEDNYSNVFDVLKQYNLPATIFVTTGYIEETSNKVLQFLDRPSKQMLSWEQIQEMDKSRLVDFGAHGHTHLAVPQTDPKDAMADMKRSKYLLEQNLGKEVQLFAYPGGFFNSKSYELLQATGFKAGFTSVCQINNKNTNSYEIGRVAIAHRHRNMPDFVYHLTRTKKDVIVER